MFNIFKTSKSVNQSIEEYLDKIEYGNLNFKKGINHYLNNETTDFIESLNTINTLEEEADTLKRKIENDFYVYSLMPNYASDIMNLLEKVDDVIDLSKDVLSQFEVESPNIPEEIKKMYIKLTNASFKSVENLVPATRTFFTSPESVKEKTQKILFYYREAHNLATELKRTIFKDLETLELSEKIHLRYFAFHIEQISDAAKVVALLLSTLVIKIKM